MSDGLRSPDAYAVLGVAPDASQSDLRRAYRRSMRRTHPDVGGDAREFADVQRAWDLIGTPQARRAYDGRRRSPGATPDSDRRVWASGPSARSAPSRARSYGHPGGWSRQRFLELIREWNGRGVPLPDPYDSALVARAPWEIRHALADALAEEATATALSDLGPAYTLWHDVITPGDAKIDHLVLGPTGLTLVQSEDWLAPVQPGGRDLIIEGSRERPIKDAVARAKTLRRWGVRPTAVVIAVPDGDLPGGSQAIGGARRPPRWVVARSDLRRVIGRGIPGVPPMEPGLLFDWRTRLQQQARLL